MKTAKEHLRVCEKLSPEQRKWYAKNIIYPQICTDVDVEMEQMKAIGMSEEDIYQFAKGYIDRWTELIGKHIEKKLKEGANDRCGDSSGDSRLDKKES